MVRNHINIPYLVAGSDVSPESPVKGVTVDHHIPTPMMDMWVNMCEGNVYVYDTHITQNIKILPVTRPGCS